MHLMRPCATKPLALICSGLLLGACAGYEVTVNERTVYTPAPLFTQFAVADANLQGCLDQTIEDGKVTAASQLVSLNCSNAGIQSLAGLGQFTQIKHLNLADNQISEAADLAKLGKLQQVILRNNTLRQLPEALTWLALESLDVSGNPDLACEDLAQLQRGQPVALSLPAHCKSAR